jgi:hypothetical protein
MILPGRSTRVAPARGQDGAIKAAALDLLALALYWGHAPVQPQAWGGYAQAHGDLQ